MVGSNLSNACKLDSLGASDASSAAPRGRLRSPRVRHTRRPGEARRHRSPARTSTWSPAPSSRAAIPSSSARTSRRSPSPRATRCTCWRGQTTTAPSTCAISDTVPGSLAGDAWLGVFKSFDGAQSWQSTLLPGLSAGPVAGGPRVAPEGLLRRGRPDGARRHERPLLLQRHRLQPRHEQRRGLRGPLPRRQPEGERRRHRREGHGQVRVDRDRRHRARRGSSSTSPGSRSTSPGPAPRCARSAPSERRRPSRPATSTWSGAALPEARARRSCSLARSTAGRPGRIPSKLSESNSINQGTNMAIDPVVRGDLRDLAALRDVEPVRRDRGREVGPISARPSRRRTRRRSRRSRRSTRGPARRSSGRTPCRPWPPRSTGAAIPAGPRRMGAARPVDRGTPGSSVDVDRRRQTWSTPVPVDAAPMTDDFGHSVLAGPPVHAAADVRGGPVHGARTTTSDSTIRSGCSSRSTIPSWASTTARSCFGESC